MVIDNLPPHVRLGGEVAAALQAGRPVVALESAVITHGLPEPHNLEAARSMDRAVRTWGAVPAICLVDESQLWIGADLDRATAVARNPTREKASVRDLSAAISIWGTAGLTVSATLFAAALAGFRVFATGGIGGVHSPAGTGDVSADLLQLSRSPVLTVCSGAKSVLDISRTLEFLETAGVPVFSYQTAEFPGFYLEQSGMTTPCLSSPAEVARVARTQWELGLETGLVLGNPIPARERIPDDEWRGWLDEARLAAERDRVQGKAVTPYLLDRVATLSGGRTVQANLALLVSNASLAAQVAVAFAS
jgi:pseudouridine-5'-phosphate glycosidase